MRRIITLDIETIPAPEPEDILELCGKKLDEYLKTPSTETSGRLSASATPGRTTEATSPRACSAGTKSMSDSHAMRQRC
jgi:hypothetical protein